jgi:cobalamin biosynthesis protein CbiD
MITLTPEQAYAAMYYFLEDYYARGQSDEIGGMLGGMSLLGDGGTTDPAVKSDWQRAVQRAMTEGDAGLAFRIVKD